MLGQKRRKVKTINTREDSRENLLKGLLEEFEGDSSDPETE